MARHGAVNIRVFGSLARGVADERSDVDFLVDFQDGCTLLDLVRLERELGELLGVGVDPGHCPGAVRNDQERLADIVEMIDAIDR